jgi:methionyl-tRNA formyltransferase
MGTPDLARTTLRALLGDPSLEVAAVVTQPDRPKGRDLKLQSPPVKDLALSAQLPVLQPARARDADFIARLAVFQPELVVVAAFGQLLPKAILDLPRYGCLNVHTSLLPRYRGAAPIQWAILNDDAETGVTIMKMDVGLDTGDIVSQEMTLIHAEDDSESLHHRLAQIGAELLLRTIPEFIQGRITPRPQPVEGVTLAPKIKKEDGRIDWSQTARKIWNQVRGLAPWPGAFTVLPAEPRPHLLKIWQAELTDATGEPGTVLQTDRAGILIACGQHSLKLLLVQREGGRRLTAQQFLAGHPLAAGQRFA